MTMVVHFENAHTGPTRLSFEPEATAPDWSKGGLLVPLFNLYVRDVDDHPRPAWIEDPDGGYAYRNRHTD